MFNLRSLCLSLCAIEVIRGSVSEDPGPSDQKFRKSKRVSKNTAKVSISQNTESKLINSCATSFGCQQRCTESRSVRSYSLENPCEESSAPVPFKFSPMRTKSVPLMDGNVIVSQ